MCLIINFLVEVSVKPIHYSLPDNRVVTTHSPLPSHLHTTFPWTFFLPPPLTLVLSVLIKYKNPYYVFSSTLTLQLSLYTSANFSEIRRGHVSCNRLYLQTSPSAGETCRSLSSSFSVCGACKFLSFSFSLSSHRHSYIGLIFSSRFIDS